MYYKEIKCGNCGIRGHTYKQCTKPKISLGVIAFKNNKPTFLEFYAEWCEVCKEMAPEVSALKDKYEKDINFVFLNVDNQKWDHYIRKFFS